MSSLILGGQCEGEWKLWVEGKRARWRRVFGELCERLSRLQGEAGQPTEAIETARAWVRHATLEEAANRRLMELLSSAGESEGPLLAYEDGAFLLWSGIVWFPKKGVFNA